MKKKLSRSASPSGLKWYLIFLAFGPVTMAFVYLAALGRSGTIFELQVFLRCVFFGTMAWAIMPGISVTYYIADPKTYWLRKLSCGLLALSTVAVMAILFTCGMGFCIF